ncbi:MAG: hypothetical protein IJ700_03020 [Bacteroidaceae bacterium]|nr:hypothetical protein [Bacteroidaceae bacterium]
MSQKDFAHLMGKAEKIRGRLSGPFVMMQAPLSQFEKAWNDPNILKHT